MGVRGLHRQCARQRLCEERIKFEKLRGVILRLVLGQGFLKLFLPEFLELVGVRCGELHARYRSPRACNGQGGRTYRLRFGSRRPEGTRRVRPAGPSRPGCNRNTFGSCVVGLLWGIDLYRHPRTGRPTRQSKGIRHGKERSFPRRRAKGAGGRVLRFSLRVEPCAHRT